MSVAAACVTGPGGGSARAAPDTGRVVSVRLLRVLPRCVLMTHTATTTAQHQDKEHCQHDPEAVCLKELHHDLALTFVLFVLV
jgi:hypothetical protein